LELKITESTTQLCSHIDENLTAKNVTCNCIWFWMKMYQKNMSQLYQ